MWGDVATQKQFALAAALAQDTLFFDFVREVIHEKMLIGDYELTDADLRIFFHRKQVQDEKAASWTDATILRLGRSYRTMLAEAGVLEQKKAGARKIYPPFLDFSTEEWLKQHAMTEIVEALSDR